MKKILVFFYVAAFFVLSFFISPHTALAAVTITPTTGGTNISADKAANASSPAYTTLGNIVIAENNNNDISSNGTFTVAPPAGWSFNTTGVTTSVTGGLTATVTSQTATLLTITIGGRSNSTLQSFTIIGLQARANDGAALPSLGDITRAGGSANVVGAAAGADLGDLSQIFGAKNKLAFTTQPSATTTINTNFPTKPVIKVQDQFGSVVTTDNTSTITYTTVLSDQPCGGTPGSGTLTSTPASGAAVSSGVLSYTAMQYSAGEAIKICAASSGLASALSNIISVAPTVLGVSASNNNGAYRAGQVIHVQVTFSSPVTVSGTSQLILSTGSPATTTASYASGSGTRILTFDYTVAAGNTSSDLDYSSITSLTLNGGTIKDTATGSTNAILTLPAPGTSGSLGANKDIIIDTTAPATPAAPDLNAADDTGISDTDNITKQSVNLTFTGTADASSTVELFDGASSKGTTIASGGNYSFTITLLAGSHSLSAVAIDNAGNRSATSSALALVVDQSAPAAPSAPDLAAADDTGLSDTDNITSKMSGLTFSGTAEASSTVDLYNGTDLIGTAFATSGAWSLIVSLPAGNHNIFAKATDAASNVSAASAPTLVVIVDNVSPATPSSPVLDPADDTGLSDTDSITNKTTGLTLWETGETGSIISIFDGANIIASTTISEGIGSVDVSLAQGTHSLTAIATDLAGNVSATSTALTLVVDTTLPSTPAVPSFDPADDTGISNSDHITKQATGLTFFGTTEASSTVELFYDGANSKGTQFTTDGNYSFSTSLFEGTHSIMVVSTDVAGNRSATSSAMSITVDTSSPAAPSIPDLVTADDDGVSNTDNITSLTSGLTFSGTAEAGSTVELFADSVSQGTTTATGGNWTMDISLDPGTHSITAVATDVAGNSSVSSGSLIVMAGSVAFPTPSIPDLDSEDDRGISNSDNITSQTSNLTFTGSAAIGSTVTIYDGATPKGTVTATVGAYSFDIDLAAGTHEISVNSYNATSSATSSALTVVIDTSVPSIPTFYGLSPSSDSGFYNNDNITNKTSNLTGGGTAEPDSTITLYLDGVSRGDVPVSSGGNWSFIGSIPAGTHYLYAIDTDIAGNTSASSTIVTIVVDTAVDPLPSAPDLNPADDTGYSNTDNITSKTSGLRFSGTSEGGSIVEIFDGANSLATSTAVSGNYSFSLDLAPGEHSLAVIATDIAGNVSDTSDITLVTVDTSAPASSSAPILDSVDDTGISNSDNITKLASGLTIFGTTDAKTIVKIFDGASLIGTVNASTSGWTADISLAAGTHSLTAVAYDYAGNVAATSTPLTIVVDTTAPGTPATPDLDPADDTGISNSDHITKQTSNLTIVGTIESGDYVELYLDGGLRGTSPATGNVWTIEGSIVANGNHTFYVKDIDVAGNESPASSLLTVTIDTITPILSENTPVPTPTNDSTPDYKFNSSEAGTIAYGGTSGCFSSQTAAVPGVNTVTFNTLSSGSYSCTIKVTDLAGNESDPLIINTFTVDTEKPVVSLVTPIPAHTNDPTPNFTFHSSEPGTITYGGSSGCSSATTAAANGDNIITLNALSDGTYGAGSCTIKVTDAAGNESVILSLNAFTIDTAKPVVIGVTSTVNDGVYNSGYVIPVIANFSEPVIVSGTPQLSLSTLSPAATPVNYVSGSGSNALAFEYTVSSGNTSSDLDYASATALILNGGSIKDSAGNDAVLTLAVPGSAGSLGANKNIVIDSNATVIAIEPVIKSSSLSITDTYIHITDSDGILLSSVSAASSTLKFSNFSCEQIDANTVDCSISIDGSGNLVITASDVLGNKSSATESGYLIIPYIPPVNSSLPIPTAIGDGASSIVISSGATRELPQITAGGLNVLLYPNSQLDLVAKVSTTYALKMYRLIIDSLDLLNNRAVLRIASTSQQAAVKLNELANFDLDSDGTPDITIKFSNLKINLMELTIKSILGAKPATKTVPAKPAAKTVPAKPAVYDQALANKLKGRILLQVQNHGAAWYVNPADSRRYYLKDGTSAYRIMSRLGVGITDRDLDRLEDYKALRQKLAGRIFLRTQSHGEAYYIGFDNKIYYLKDGAAAYRLLRTLGLGITNNNLFKIPEGR